VNKEGTRAWVANRFSNDLSVIDLQKQREIARIPMVREPKSVVLSSDGKIVAVGNYLHNQSALDNLVAAEITLVDAVESKIIRNIPLCNGAQSLEDLCFSEDGSLLFATHILSRFQLPAFQMERGWMNSNALSVIDIPEREYYTTVLLDNTYRGAANPSGLSLSEDGEKLYVAISGTHELIVIDLPVMQRKMRRADREELSTNLTFMNDCKVRIPLAGKGARRLIEKDNKVFVTDYFSGGLSVVDFTTPVKEKFVRFIKLDNEPEMNAIRKGELLFADAELCFQNWQSCLSCHPDGRSDGLNWDLANDGLGNPKNTKSMLYSHVTPPCMITGIRADAEIAVRAGIRNIQLTQRPEEDAVCIDKYLSSLSPLPSPYLVNGKLSPVAEKGKAIYEQAGCNQCHNGDYLTDMQMCDVGVGTGKDTDIRLDTPTLKEIWRTAPYLYDGRAKTIKEVLTIFNQEDKHGVTSRLTEEEIDALEQYVLSL